MFKICFVNKKIVRDFIFIRDRKTDYAFKLHKNHFMGKRGRSIICIKIPTNEKVEIYTRMRVFQKQLHRDLRIGD